MDGAVGSYISSIDINLDCKVKSCGTEAIRSFRVQNLRNRFSTKTHTGSFSVTTYDDEQYAFDSSSTLIEKSSLKPNLSPGVSGNFVSIDRSVKATASATDLTLIFSNNVRLAKASII